jgi:hypothetical protein
MNSGCPRRAPPRAADDMRLALRRPTHGELGLGALASLDKPELVTAKSLPMTNIVVNPVGSPKANFYGTFKFGFHKGST